MHALPPLDLAGLTVRLPLSQGAAVQLVDALLSMGDDRVRLVAEAVRSDPALAVWGICRAMAAGERNLTSPELLAAWLAPRLTEEFARFDFATSTTTPPLEKKFAPLAAAATRVADRCAALARKAHDQDADAARFAGLLHVADEWLAAAGVKRETAARAALPEWLSSLLAELRTSPATNATADARAALVRKARDERPARGAARVSSKPPRTRPPWRVANDDAARRLVTLAERLARLERLETRFAETLEAEKLEALAELAAGAGHEFNPPLAVISGRAQLFLRDEPDAERRRELAVINRQALRVHEMIADLMHFARPALPRPAECDVVALVREALAGLATSAEDRRIALEFSTPHESLLAELDATQMLVAVRAVVTNSLEALGSDGRVNVECKRIARESGFEIVVRDTGHGITPEIRRHLFDPFYSGRGAGRGLGLGLSKCWRIVTNHGGRIEVDSTLGQGTTVRLVLPVTTRTTTVIAEH